MASKTLKTRFSLNNKTASEWTSNNTFVPLKGEMCVETDTFKAKLGDGVQSFKDLPYMYLTKTEIQTLIDGAKYTLPVATASALGGVKIGTNVDVASDGTISIKDGTTGQKGVVQLSSSTSSTSETLAATAKAVKTAYDLAAAAVPKSGGTMTGLLVLSADPTANLGAATKQYVDNQITTKLQASDAMVFKGTLGASGTITALPTAQVVQGDTYKVITAGTYAGYACKVGDLLIANASGSLDANATNWSMVPSGDENETSIRYATSGVNLTTTAKTGSIILGEASIKQVDTSIAAASSSVNLPTSAAVAAFVEGKGYQTTDNKVLNTLATTTKFYVTGTTGTATNTGSQYFDTGVYVGATAGELYATTFRGALVGNVTGNVSGNASTASKWASGRTITLSGDVSGSATIDGSADVTLTTTIANDSHDHTQLLCTDITGQTVDVNTYNLSTGSPHKKFYIQKTAAGAANITNIPVSGNPFVLTVELVHYSSATDYITKQTFVSSGDKSTYERWCTNGTWASWLPVARFSATPVGDRILLADGTSGAIKSSNYTVGAAAAKGIADSSSAEAIGTGTNLTTERDVYYGLPTINNSHAYTSSTTIYAPTVGGTSGYILKATGSTSAPEWIAQSSIAAGTAAKLASARNFSITNMATAAAVSFDGSGNVALSVTDLNAMGLYVNTSDTLILDGSI